jgi:hypothetical protein
MQDFRINPTAFGTAQARYIHRCAPWIFVLALGILLAVAGDFVIGAAAAQEDKKDGAGPFLTFSGYVLALLGAILGAGGGLRFFLEPVLKRRRLRKVMATGLWLSCSELRRHLEAIKATLASSNPAAMRNSLKKIPLNDTKGEGADWLVKDGYFCMITAYKIAAFSSWMKIYQRAVLRILLTVGWSRFISELFEKFDSYKIAASQNTVLWYNYIDAIGEKIIVAEADFSSPLGFSDFCKKYNSDREFLEYFDQLHMFIHFLGSDDQRWMDAHQTALNNMIVALQSIEEFIRKHGWPRTVSPRSTVSRSIHPGSGSRRRALAEKTSPGRCFPAMPSS